LSRETFRFAKVRSFWLFRSALQFLAANRICVLVIELIHHLKMLFALDASPRSSASMAAFVSAFGSGAKLCSAT
jgi:hypothetical protein